MFELFRILRVWLNNDRIRVSPREAKLLRLTPGACIRIGDAAYTVEYRTACNNGGATVVYHCRGIDAEMDLVATIADDGSIQATMTTDNRMKAIAGEDVECF